MTKSAFNKYLKEIIYQITENYKPDKIILFGSAADGNMNKNSDIDLFIIKNDKRRGIDRTLEVLRSFKHKIATDVIVFTPDEVKRSLKWEDPFIKNIIEKGKVLYGKKTSH